MSNLPLKERVCMWSRLLLLAIFAIMAVSCAKQRRELAPLTRDQMVSIMMDVYVSEAKASYLPLTRDSAYRLFVAHQDSLLHRHRIADSTLRKAYSYYLNHPEEFEMIYDAIIDSLNLRQQLLPGQAVPQP
jgi:hypothetical protein